MKKIFISLILLLTIFSTIAGKEAYFKHLSTADGSTLSSAISMWQDQLGNIWFGNNLLNKYDGNTIRTYRISEYIDNVQGINISQIYGNTQSLIYILADYELIVFDTSSGKFHNPSIKAQCIFSNNDSLYYAYENRLYIYNHADGQSEKILETPLSTENITCMHIAAQNKIWLGTNKRLYKVENDAIRCIIPSINTSCLYVDSGNNTWAGTIDDGIRIICSDSDDITTIKDNKDEASDLRLSNNRIRCINEDNQQNIWIGTYEGITLISPDRKKSSFLTHNENISYSLQHNSIYSIYKDRQGTMWIGTYYGGVSYFNPDIELYQFYDTNKTDKTMLNGFIIGPMTEDKDNLYIATEEGGINRRNKKTGKITRYEKENGALPHNTIKSIWYDREYKQLFAGTFTEGLLVKKDNSETFHPIGDDVLSTSRQRIISKILPYNEKYIIILTQEEAYKLNRKTYEITTLLPGQELTYAEAGIIHALYPDSDNKLWVYSLQKGLFTIDIETQEIKYFNDPDKYPNFNKSIVRQIIGGDQDKLYLLSQSSVFGYDRQTDSFRVIHEADSSFTANSYYNITSLKSGRLVITVDNNLVLLEPSTHKQYNLSLSKLSLIKSINESCGLYVSPVNEEIFVGGIGGMITLFEEDIIAMTTPDYDSYQLYLSSLSVNNKPVNATTDPDILKKDISYSKSVKLTYKQNNISLSFASSDYIHTNLTVYEYKLENFDEQWNTTNNKFIRYTSLPPGTYQLKIREVNNLDKKTELGIVITPPFYASVWAYIIYTIAGIFLIIYIIRFTRKNALLRASLQMELREKANLEKLNKIKQNFFTNVSHEFRTPLTLILSQLDITLKDGELQRSIKNRLQKIKKHTSEMQHLINELTHLSKLEQGYFPVKVSRHDISLFIKDIYIAFKEYAQIRHITFNSDFSEEPVNVWFDYVQLQKVIYNLLSNAFKFTEEGGTITISLKRKQHVVEITVEDNGIGIGKEDIDKVFEQYYQVNGETSSLWMEGMGVGLSLSKEIVRQHSGEIFVESTVGERTRFTVRLPLGDAHFTDQQKEEWVLNENIYMPKPLSEETEKIKEKTIQGEKAHGKSILIIEDNEELLALLTEAFSAIYHVYTAGNGEEGLQKAIEVLPNLILTDVMIPRLSGLEVCKKLKANVETAHIPVILITAHSSLKQNIEGLQYGADDYITKPFDMELLLLKCHNLIKSHSEIRHKSTSPIIDNTKNEDRIATNQNDQKFIDEAIRIAELHISNTDFDTTIWSKELKIGRSKLFNRIKEITGYTPNEYLLILKMKKATLLLKEQAHLTVAEIAYQLGFSSPGYFSKCFKEQIGVTPMQYRNS